MKNAQQILQLIVTLLPLVSELVSQVQVIFGSGTGPIKKAVVLESVMDALAQDRAPLVLSEDVVRNVVDRLIERQVEALKAVTQPQPPAGAAAG